MFFKKFIRDSLLKQRVFMGTLCVGSGILFVLALPPFHYADLAWGVLIPILFSLKFFCKNWKEAFLGGFSMGLVWFGGALWWISHVSILGAIAVVLYLSLFPALWAWAAWKILVNTQIYSSWKNIKNAAILGALWVLIEWVRGWFLSGFGWNGLCVTQYQSPLILQGASLGGVYLLDWVLAYISGIGFFTLLRFYKEIKKEQKMRMHWDFSLSVAIVALLFSYGFNRLFEKPKNDRSLRYASVQGNIPQYLKLQSTSNVEILEKHIRLSRLALLTQPQILIWPETTMGNPIQAEILLSDIFKKFQEKLPLAFLWGDFEMDKRNYYNAAFFRASSQDGLSTYRKRHLVLFGEYVPLVNWFPFLRNLVPYVVGVKPGKEASVFTWTPQGSEKPITLAPIICFEDTIPRLMKSLVDLKPDVLVNITNDGWFKKSPGATQHLANAVFRSVEFGLPMIRAANTGITCVISERGIIVNRLVDTHQNDVAVGGILSGEIFFSSQREKTYYEIGGNWIVWFSAMIVFFQLASFYRRKKI